MQKFDCNQRVQADIICFVNAADATLPDQLEDLVLLVDYGSGGELQNSNLN
jgi:hypothetical protein